MENNRIKPAILVAHIITIAACTLISYLGYLFVNSSQYKSIDSLGDNWNLSPILKAEFSKKTCSELGMVDIIVDQWPGTNEGCDCTNKVTDKNGTIEEGTCSRFKGSSEKNCKDVASIANKTYSIWRNHHFCGQLMNVTNYFDLLYVKKSDECMPEYKSCGLLDTLQNKLCVNSQDECPLNFLKIVSAEAAATYDITKYNKNGPLTDGKFLITSNKHPESSLAIQFLVSQGKPCLDNSYFNFKFETNILSKMHDKNECPIPTGLNKNTVYDDSVEIDEDSLRNVFDENDITQSLEKISYYHLPNSDDKVKLFIRSFNGVNEECKKTIVDKGKVNNIANLGNFRDSAKSVKLLAAYGAGFCLACLILISLNYIYNLVGYFFLKSRDFFFELSIMVYPIIIVSCLTQCVMFTLSYIKSINGTDFSKYLDGCTDENLQNIISVFSSKFSVGQILILISLILSLGFLILNILLYCKKKNLELEELDKNTEMVDKQIY